MTDTEELLRLENDILKKENIALKESQDRFATVFERSSLGNKIINAELTILQVNQALVTLLGYENKEEIIGTKIFDYAPQDRRGDWAFLQKNLWANLMPSFNLETCLIKKDGELIWCQVTSILIPDNGHTLGFTIIEDVTEKRSLRLQREEFISVASHELKTPITVLKMTVQLMNKILKKDSEAFPALTKLSLDAERQVTKLRFLVKDLLNTTRLEQGQLALNLNLFTISEVIEGCCGHITMSGYFKMNYLGDHSIKIMADQQKIEQVIVNLVNNAVKYAPDSKDIDIHVEHVDNLTRVSITDHGNGIEKDSLTYLFDRFYRASNDKNKYSGLGLGLYISSEIIKRHGGEMGVQSRIGEGATFWFTLPDVDEAN